MTELMKAVGYYHALPLEDPDSFLDLTLPIPNVSGRDLLIEVKAVSVNPVDTKQRTLEPQNLEPRILGFDAAGVVKAVGPDCTLFSPGDEVFYAGDVTRPGSNSHFQLVDERLVAKKPSQLTFAEAAAMPLTSLTAYEALFERLAIEPNSGKTILIIAASGGVGSIATQLANHAGLTVIGTASRSETVTWTKEHGTAIVLNHHQPLPPQLHAQGYDYVDYILCLNNTDAYWDVMAELIAPQGKICSIVENEHPLELGKLKSKSATFVWEFMFTKAMYQTKDLYSQHEILTTISQLLDQGAIRSTLTETLRPISAKTMRAAHQKVESGKMIGKVVLESY